MNHLLQKLIFTLTLALSATLVTSVGHAKDEPDTSSKTSTTKDTKAKESSDTKSTAKDSKTKDSKEKDSKEKKSSDTKSTANESKVNSADKSTKDSKKTDSTTSKKVNDSKSSTKADTKADKTSSKTSQQSTTTSSSSKKATTTTTTTTNNNTAKKQYKNVVVNLNKAGVETFSHYLMGIGKVKAEAIVAYRKENGKFKTIDDLLKITGIGDKVFAGLKKNVSLTTGKTSVSQADKSATTKAK